MNDIEIYGLAYGGMGIGKVDGKVCFVEGALPGERVRFDKESEKKRFIVGRVTEILTSSEDRIEAVCPYYGRCGGCQYQHLGYEKEAYYKGEQVKEILARIGGLKEYTFEGIIPSPIHYGYRSSVTVHRSPSGYGYFSRDNKTIISIDQCPIAANGISDTIAGLDHINGKRDITLKHDSAGNVWIKGRSGHRFFKDIFLGTELTFSPLAFSQVNRQVAASMVETLRGWIEKHDRETLFDLYCGVGFFGILLRDLFNTIVGVDDNAVAIDCAKTAKRDLGIQNIKFYQSDEKTFPLYYERSHSKMNTLILDPPRSGIDKTLLEWLNGLTEVNYLYYISCDPAILGRDTKLLMQNGTWALARVASFDIFARTKHIESIAMFKKR
ncbi:MAG: methyltransferase domain-containing protein [Candidatus Omnitrophota bacterium]